MRSAPSGFLIESLLFPRDTIPAKVMQTIVLADGLDDMRRLVVASFATIDRFVLARYHDG
jgi:hypothetical protein